MFALCQLCKSLMLDYQLVGVGAQLLIARTRVARVSICATSYLSPPDALWISYPYDRGLTRLRVFHKQGSNVITLDRSADGQIVFRERYAEKTPAVGTERIPCE